MDKMHPDPPRQKRLKVARACSECRRKKTKCDNGQPCAPCTKSYSDCQYTTTQFGHRRQSTLKSCQSTGINNLTLITTTTTITTPPTSATCTTSDSTVATICTIEDSTSTTTGADLESQSHNNLRLRSPSKRPMAYTILAIEHRLLEIEKTLGLLLQRQHPSLPPLVVSPPSSSTSSSSTASSLSTANAPHFQIETAPETNGTKDHNSGESAHHMKQHRPTSISPSNTLILPPLQTRPTPPPLHNAGIVPLIPSLSATSGSTLSYDTHKSIDRKIPGLTSLLQHGKQEPGNLIKQQQQPTYHHHHHYHHHHLNPIPPS